MNELKPYSRDEVLLDNIAKALAGAEIAEIAPYTRKETLLNNIAEAVENGGGGGGGGLPEVTSADNGDVLAVVDGAWAKSDPPSGLPPYTSADKGKVLTIGEDAEHTTEMTAVPQQDVTEEYGEGVITNVDTSLFGEGYAFTMTINNSTYTGTITKESGQLVANVVPDPDGDAYYAIVAGDPNTYFYTNEDGTYSVKLTIAVPNAKDVWDYVKVDELVIYNSGAQMLIKGHEQYSYDEFFIELYNAITNKKPTIRVYKDNALVPCNISVDNNTMRSEFNIYSGIEREMYAASRGGTWVHYTTILVPDASILPNGTYQLTKTGGTLEWTAVT